MIDSLLDLPSQEVSRIKKGSVKIKDNYLYYDSKQENKVNLIQKRTEVIRQPNSKKEKFTKQISTICSHFHCIPQELAVQVVTSSKALALNDNKSDISKTK